MRRSGRLWFLAFFPSPPFGLLVFPFILACIPYPMSTCRFGFPRLILVPSAHTQSGWGLVVKAEEHGSVKCKVFNGNNGSFPFVSGRYTIQRPFPYQHRYFRLFLKLFLYRFCLFFQRDHGCAEDRIVLGYVPGLLGLLLHVLGYTPPRLEPWAPM